MIRFYAPDIESTGMLPEVESGHCCRVLRKQEGDVINVVDGKGNAFECRIIDAHPKKTMVEINSKVQEKPHWDCRITIAIAPTKNMDRMEWFVEKIVELGVDEIVFLNCEHSERKIVKPERVEKIMISAMTQSMKSKMPVLRANIPFKDFIAGVSDSEKFMGYCNENFPLKCFVKEYHPGEDVAVLIGPEGDFSPAEVERAVDAGFVPVSFGATRLRTETAGLYAVCAVHAVNSLIS